MNYQCINIQQLFESEFGGRTLPFIYMKLENGGGEINNYWNKITESFNKMTESWDIDLPVNYIRIFKLCKPKTIIFVMVFDNQNSPNKNIDLSKFYIEPYSPEPEPINVNTMLQNLEFNKIDKLFILLHRIEQQITGESINQQIISQTLGSMEETLYDTKMLLREMRTANN